MFLLEILYLLIVIIIHLYLFFFFVVYLRSLFFKVSVINRSVNVEFCKTLILFLFPGFECKERFKSKTKCSIFFLSS